MFEAKVYDCFSKLPESDLFSINGGAGIVNIVGGVTAVASIVGCIFPPVFLVAAIGGCYLIGYGIGEAIRG